MSFRAVEDVGNTREPFLYRESRRARYFPLNLSLKILTGIKNFREDLRILWLFVRPPPEMIQCICTWYEISWFQVCRTWIIPGKAPRYFLSSDNSRSVWAQHLWSRP